jgi:N-methylhydantoinase A
VIYRLGVDVGGTFTDFAIHNAVTGELTIGKTLTSSVDPSRAVLEGLDRLTQQLGITVVDLGQAMHATTIATNAVIQRRGAVTALVTTQGFRDVLRIGRQKRWDLYDNMTDKPEPLVPRHLIWEVPERVLYDGSVHKPLDRRAMRRVATKIRKAGVESVAVCFIHSYANAAHERQAAAIVREVAPRVLVTVSSDVAPLIREYERSNTTVVNAYLMPLIRDYIRRIRRGLRQRGFRQDLFIMQSNGGLATSRVVDRYPIRIIESGPAAGVLTAAKFAGAAGTTNLLSFDMGGTTAKMCLIEDGRATKTGLFEIDMINLKKHSGLPLSIPAIDLVEIGTGGGSVAAARMTAIAVGPESAGADPGPICYGRGGSQPTVTDADLVLGYLNENYFLGGEMRLDVGGARRGVDERVGRPLGIDLIEAAWGIHEVANYQMARAARAVSVAKGEGPSELRSGRVWRCGARSWRPLGPNSRVSEGRVSGQGGRRVGHRTSDGGAGIRCG